MFADQGEIALWILSAEVFWVVAEPRLIEKGSMSECRNTVAPGVECPNWCDAVEGRKVEFSKSGVIGAKVPPDQV